MGTSCGSLKRVGGQALAIVISRKARSEKLGELLNEALIIRAFVRNCETSSPKTIRGLVSPK